MYDLDYLIETFSKHAERTKQRDAEIRLEYCNTNPGKPLPLHLLDDFNFPEALASICIEIKHNRDCKDSFM